MSDSDIREQPHGLTPHVAVARAGYSLKNATPIVKQVVCGAHAGDGCAAPRDRETGEGRLGWRPQFESCSYFILQPHLSLNKIRFRDRVGKLESSMWSPPYKFSLKADTPWTAANLGTGASAKAVITNLGTATGTGTGTLEIGTEFTLTSGQCILLAAGNEGGAWTITAKGDTVVVEVTYAE